MELHKRFINIAVLEYPIFEIIVNAPILKDSISLIIQKFLENCSKSGTEESNIKKKYLELLRILFCKQYKLNYEEAKKKIKFYNEFGCFIELLFYSNMYNKMEYQFIISDIIVLYLVLLEDKSIFIQLFENFRSNTTSGQFQVITTVTIEWYLKVLKCFLNTWDIYNFLNDKKDFVALNKTDLEFCKKVLLSSIVNDLKNCIQCTENHEWYALYSVLSKLVEIAKSNAILTSYINVILDKNFGLTTLCVISNFVFPSNCLYVDTDYNLLYNNKFWFTIQQNIISSNLYDRKEALYLLKRSFDFIDENEQFIKESIPPNLSHIKRIPFICCNKKIDKLSLKKMRINYILIIEALEEKQMHLIQPVLSFVDNLIEIYKEHKSCGSCYDFSWIYCIFARIFMHNSITIIKWGLLRSLNIDAEAYTYDKFIMLILKTLNNKFLYEISKHENEPSIVTALTIWFNKFQSDTIHLVEKCILFLNRVSWNPIAIYYVLQSIFFASKKLDQIVKLQYEQLDVIKFMVETNINLHPPMLQFMSQNILIKILSRFCEIKDLMVLCNIISTFSKKILKEPSCWLALILWLKKIDYTYIFNFFNQVCDMLTVNDENVQISMFIFALIIQLLYEGKIIFCSEKCIVMQKLTKLFQYLNKIDVRPYVKLSFTVKMIDFLYNLFDLQNVNIKFPKFIHKLFNDFEETLFQFILKLFKNYSFDYKYIEICKKALQNVNNYRNDQVNALSIFTDKNSKYLEKICIQVLSNINEDNQRQLLLALQIWSNISNKYIYDDNFFIKIICNLIKIYESKKYVNEQSVKIRLDYYIALSKLIKNHISTLNVQKLKPNDNWLQVISSIVDIAGNHVLIYFGDIMLFYVANNFKDDNKLENFKHLIRTFWNCNFSNKRNKVFWLVAQKINKCIISPEFLNNKTLKDVLQEYLQKMLIEGDKLQGLKFILLTSNEIKTHFIYFMEIILNGLMHGQVMRHDQRINMQTLMAGKKILSSYKLKDGEISNFEVYNFLNRQCNIDAIIRAVAVLQLSNALHFDNENASLFLPLVLQKLIESRNKRYFAHSQLHRLRHRTLQILLILQPFLNKKCVQILYDAICDSIIQDNDQPSLRLMKEWILIRIYLSNQNLLPDLWVFFEKIYRQRPTSIISVIGIIWHLAQQLSSQQLVEFIKIALSKLGICCMKQQFQIRLFGQVFFIKFYELLEKNSNTYIEYSSLYKAILESVQSDNLKKNSVNINDHFFYVVFNPIQHYSLETIYYELPRLCNISVEEWISKENFKELIFLDTFIADIKITNDDDILNTAEIPNSFLKPSRNIDLEEFQYSEIATDVQKKFAPWKIISPNDEELMQIINLSDLKKNIQNKRSLIVVASLVDKSQNLGGIARTCEIFGAKELVVSNLKQTEEKEFQTLSVSADKWIKIIEVKSFLLDKYLMEMKDCGWTLIGAEQTANSISLIDLKFPKQTVLILGNEKYGIPANILPLLDICVQIPQIGITRSLNVHVTCAICVWEYIKQQIQF